MYIYIYIMIIYVCMRIEFHINRGNLFDCHRNALPEKSETEKQKYRYFDKSKFRQNCISLHYMKL